MNWNERITINGHEITVTPQPGMVVEYEGGWYIIQDDESLSRFDAWDDNGRFFDLELLLFDSDETFKAYAHAPDCRPTLLAPSDLYTPWDAIIACFPNVGNKAYIPAERGFIAAHAPLPDKPNVGFGYSLHVNGKTYAAAVADMQKYGVLLAWLKQWEEKCVSL